MIVNEATIPSSLDIQRSPKAALVRQIVEQFIKPYFMGLAIQPMTPLTTQKLVAVAHHLAQNPSDIEEPIRVYFATKNAQYTRLKPSQLHFDDILILLTICNLIGSAHEDADQGWLNSHTFLKSSLTTIQRYVRLPTDIPHILARHWLIAPLLETTVDFTQVSLGNMSTRLRGKSVPGYIRLFAASGQLDMHERTEYLIHLLTQTETLKLRLAQSDLLSAILDRSPLSRWLFLGHKTHDALQLFKKNQKYDTVLAAQMQVLEYPELARIVVDDLLEKGLGLVGEELAQSILWILRRSVPGLVIRRMMELSTHLLMMGCWLYNAFPKHQATRELALLLEHHQRPSESALPFYAAAYVTHHIQGHVIPSPSLEHISPGFHKQWNLLMDRLREHDIARIAAPLEKVLKKHLK